MKPLIIINWPLKIFSSEVATSEVGEEEAAPAETEEGEKEEVVEAAPPKKEALRNQFNFSERASQTFNNPYRVSEIVLMRNLVCFY